MVEEFAMIVGLLSAFSAGREANKASDIAEFQHWLTKHKHEEIIELLKNDAETNSFVEAYLNQQIPEIQTKLDTIITLVQTIATERMGDNEVGYSGRHYLKGMVLIGLERVMHSGLGVNDFDMAYAHVTDIIGAESLYNQYVLERMIRDSLERKVTASNILGTYWADLID